MNKCPICRRQFPGWFELCLYCMAELWHDDKANDFVDTTTAAKGKL